LIKAIESLFDNELSSYFKMSSTNSLDFLSS